MRDDLTLMVVEKLCQKTGELIGILGVGRGEGKNRGRGKGVEKRGGRMMDNGKEDW